MIVIRSCCENNLPTVRKTIDGRYMVFCSHCGLTTVGETVEDALNIWNDLKNGRCF